MISLQKINTSDASLSRIQDNVERALRILGQSGLVDGVLVENVALVGGSADNIVSHGLQRRPRGFLVVAKNATTDVWNSITLNPTEELTIILQSTNAATVSLWIF